jgi:hypothetical protein
LVAPLTERWGIAISRAPWRRRSYELDTNWKHAIENYLESYHLPWCIRLNSYSRMSDHYTFSGIRCRRPGTTVYAPAACAVSLPAEPAGRACRSRRVLVSSQSDDRAAVGSFLSDRCPAEARAHAGALRSSSSAMRR